MTHLGTWAFVAIALAVPPAVSAADAKGPPASKKSELHALWPDGAPGAKGKAAADVPGVYLFLPAKDKANGAAVVICPGGGYGHLAISYEGDDVARWLNTLGVVGVVLRYRHAPAYRHPIPMHDAQRALRYVRAHAKEWNVDPKRVGVLGFSAGGHLASTVSTHFDDGKTDARDPIDRLSCRPDFSILVYPVISLRESFAHIGSRNNLLGKSPDSKLVEYLSSERQVTKQTPPAFLVHTSEDRAVPPENSVAYYLALRRLNIPTELHVYEKGRHGLGLGRENLPFRSWPARCADWLRGRGYLGETKKAP